METGEMQAIDAVSRKRLWAIRVLALLAAALSGLLLMRSLGGAVTPGCRAGSSCDAVLGSAWSQVLGVPVTAPAVAMYVVILAASLHVGAGSRDAQRRVAWLILVACGAAAGAAAVWFMGLQLLAIRAICMWCTGAHVLGFALAAAVAYAAPRYRLVPHAAVAGLAAIACVAAIQVLFPADALRVHQARWGPQATGTGRLLLNGRVRLEPAEFPLVGSPDAPGLVVEVFDYTCGHCRKLHPFLNAARDRYGQQLVIVSLPLPLDGACNPLIAKTEEGHETACELAKIALGVWRVRPEAFADIHDWMMRQEPAAEPQAALMYARDLVGEEALREAMDDPVIPALIERTANLYRLPDLRGRSLPLLLTEKGTIVGRPRTQEEFYRVLEDITPIESPGVTVGGGPTHAQEGRDVP